MKIGVLIGADADYTCCKGRQHFLTSSTVLLFKSIAGVSHTWQIAGGKEGERERLREGKRRVDAREGERERVCVCFREG